MTSPITPEIAVYELTSLTGAKVSPDGTSILYHLAQTDRESGATRSQVWRCSIDGAHPRQISHAGVSNAGAAWSPDGTSIAWVSRRDGDHPGAIVVLPLDGGEARVVTSHASMPSSLRWSPDGRSIAYIVETDPDNPEEKPKDPKAPAPVIVVDRLDYKLDGRGVYNRQRQQCFVVDVETGNRRQLSDPETHAGSPSWSPDGKTLAVTTDLANSHASTLTLIDVESGERTETGIGGFTGASWWTPDGGAILYLGDPGETYSTAYCLYDVASKNSGEIVADLAFQPDTGYQNTSPIGDPVWIGDHSAVVHGLSRGRSLLAELDIAAGTVTPIVDWDALHGGLSATPDGKVIVQNRSTLSRKSDLVSWNRDTGELKTLVTTNDAVFAETPMADVEFFTFERAGFEIDCWLLKPPGFDAAQTYPLVLSVHGGPHNAYGHQFDIQAQVLAAAGYLVLMTNPRGSGTYGRAFTQSVHGDWGGEDWNDLMHAVDLIVERPYVDAARLGIYGYSYGGYITAWAVGHTDRFAAIVCGAPVYDMISMYGTSDIGFFFTPMEMKADQWERRDFLIERSPSTYAKQATTPTLIIQGEADERCPVGQAEQMFTDLKLAGCETQLVRYPGGSHLMLSNAPAAHRIDYLTRVRSWFDRFLSAPAN
jgi:dipeptidyl aminopeptidase/acylaminoacyl peptidase